MTILKLALNLKSIVKSQETREQNLLEKQFHVRDLHQRNQQTFRKFEEIFMIAKMIIVKKVYYLLKIRINGSNIKNVNNERTGKSNQGKFAFFPGDSMVKDVDGYLLTGSIN